MGLDLGKGSAASMAGRNVSTTTSRLVMPKQAKPANSTMAAMGFTTNAPMPKTVVRTAKVTGKAICEKVAWLAASAVGSFCAWVRYSVQMCRQ